MPLDALLNAVRRGVHARHYAPLDTAWQLVMALPTLIYGGVIHLQHQLRRLGWRPATIVKCPVITIGNVTTGGTGKTPVVEALCSELVRAGHRPLILTRGYGALEPLAYGEPQHAGHGDEAYELKLALSDLDIPVPVVVGKNRAKNAQRALQQYAPSVMILDDGLQSRTVEGTPQINCLLIDGPNGLGNGKLLPTGPLREPVRHALSRASVIGLTRVDSEDQARIHARLPEFSASSPVVAIPIEPEGLQNWQTGEHVPLDWLAHRPVVALCGVAQPDRFLSTLMRHRAITLASIILSDHAGVTSDALRKRLSGYPAKTPLVMTRKDAVKLPALPPETPVWIITQRAEVRPLFEAIALRLQPAGISSGG